MRDPFPRSRAAVALIMTLLIVLSVPAPALSAPPSPAEDPYATGPESQGSGDNRANAKWTYLVYMAADNNLEDEAILNVNQMEVVGSSGNVSIVIQFDRSPLYDETNENWTGTRRYYVTADADPDIINSQLVEDMGEVDMGNADRLRDFVVWGITNYPADRYYLDVWGHGGGWRDGTCNDYTSGSAIDTDELGDALSEAQDLTDTALDGVGFDQCLMAQLEVFYEIKAIADVLVGAETLIPSEGYNYTRVMESLDADPGMDAHGLATVLVRTFFDEYGHDNERAHSAVDSEGLDAGLAPAVTQLSQVLRGKAETLHDEIKMARDHTQTYSTTDYIDLGNFTEMLLLYIPENETEIRQAAIEVRENVTTAVVAEDHGTGRNGSTGMSFYFPKYGASWAYDSIMMSIEQRWDEFLDAYYNRVDRPNVAPTVDVDGPLTGSVVGLEFELLGTAGDTDGNVTSVEWKFDRGDWKAEDAGNDWSVNISTEGMTPGFHRISVRSRDDDGDYSREVQYALNVESRGLGIDMGPRQRRAFAGATIQIDMKVHAFGDEGGIAGLEVVSLPVGWRADLPFGEVTLGPRGIAEGTIDLTVAGVTPNGIYEVIFRAWMTDAPLIQTFARIEVNITDHKADLVAESITFNPIKPEEGKTVLIGWTSRNRGLLSATAFNATLTHREYDGEAWTEMVMATSSHDTLDVGFGASQSVEWTATIGYHEFILTVDPEERVPDLDRSNNVLTVPFLLEGYDVAIVAEPLNITTGPGNVETFHLNLTNMGNLDDVLQLLVINTTLRWEAELNDSSWYLLPKASTWATLVVRVPDHATGGIEDVITLRVISYEDKDKFQDVVLRLSIPETFAMHVSQDMDHGNVGSLGTVSFNITIENAGNGYENYTIDYIRQTADLLVSAVNDTVEVAPGCSTQVEVFLSSLGTGVGGRTLEHGFTIRSVDNSSVMGTLSYSVSIAKVFGLRAVVVVPTGGFEALPGQAFDVTLAVYSEANYAVPMAIHVTGDEDAFEPALLQLETIKAGGAETYDLILTLKRQVLLGEYEMWFSVHEVNSTENATTAMYPVKVLRVDDSSLSIVNVSEEVLMPDGTWRATLLIRNMGNHMEIYSLNASGVPEWIIVTFEGEVFHSAYDFRRGGDQGSAHLIRVPAHGEIEFQVLFSMLPTVEKAPKELLMVVTATPLNVTDDPPSVVLDITTDIPESDDGMTFAWWYLVLALVLIAIVIVALQVVSRRRQA